jgi:hypothetical protein
MNRISAGGVRLTGMRFSEAFGHPMDQIFEKRL